MTAWTAALGGRGGRQDARVKRQRHGIAIVGLIFACAGWLGQVAADRIELEWNLTYSRANPDGLFDRRVIGINGQWPPAPLVSHFGDTLAITVHNQLETASAIHNHGLYFYNSSYYDGSMGVTQCGIPPGGSLLYEFQVQNWPGTYWTHGHSVGQYVDGLRTPHVILPPRNASLLTDPAAVALGTNTELTSLNASQVPWQNGTQYDDEYVVALGDWYHQEHDVLLAQFLNVYNPTGAEPVPDSGLMYLYHGDQLLPGFNENATMTFLPGKRYRLRIVNMSAFAMWFVWLDGHDMEIIEIDGTDVQATPAESLMIAAAQRVSVLVTAKNTTTSNFQLHGNMDVNMFDKVPEALQPNVTLTVQYDAGAAIALPQTVAFDGEADYPTVMDTDLIPIYNQATTEPDVQIPLNVFFDVMTDGINRGMFNNMTYITPPTPSIFTAQTMGQDAVSEQVYGVMTHAHVLKKDDWVQLNIYNWDANAHPFHLHGHKFQIVSASDDGSVDPATAGVPPQQNPIRRDTVVVEGGGGNVALRFKADNPGTWFFHCHIEWHLQAGLAIVFVEAPLESQSRIPIPDSLSAQCQAQGIMPSGNAAGILSTTDFTGAPTGPVTQTMGFQTKGIVALVFSIISALLGMATVVWYSWPGLEEDTGHLSKNPDSELTREPTAEEGNISTREETPRELTHID